jgi:hypothetical protein
VGVDSAQERCDDRGRHAAFCGVLSIAPAMSGDELGRKDRRSQDGIALVSDAHEAGRLEGLMQAYTSAREAPSLERLADDLLSQIAEITAMRDEDS